MAREILGENWMPEYVHRANQGGIERVLVVMAADRAPVCRLLCAEDGGALVWRGAAVARDPCRRGGLSGLLPGGVERARCRVFRPLGRGARALHWTW